MVVCGGVCGSLWWSVVVCGSLWWSVVFMATQFPSYMGASMIGKVPTLSTIEIVETFLTQKIPKKGIQNVHLSHLTWILQKQV